MSMNVPATEHPDPVTHLRGLTDLATPFAVRVAASLRLADHMASGVDSLDDLAGACGADRDTLGRLLRFLVGRGVFVEPSPGVFALTGTGRLLCDQGAAGQRGWLDLAGLGARMDLAYTGLLHSVRTGTPAYEVVHGRSLWADLDAEPALREYFDELMLSRQRLTAPQVAALYDWPAAGHVVDVGGGSGGLLAEVLRAHEHLRGTLVDRPRAARAAARRFAEWGLSARAEAVEGDFFTMLPAGGDVYVVSRALTDWSDRDAAAILRRCGQAAGRAGRVLVVEVLPTDPHMPYLTPYDLQMLVVVGGRERGEAEHAALAGAAGLAVSRTLHGTGGLVLIELAAARDGGGASG